MSRFDSQNFWDATDFFLIGFDPPGVNDETQEFFWSDFEGALQGVEFHVVPAEDVEHFREVVDMIAGLFWFDQHVIHIHLHGFPNLVFKKSINHSSISGTGIREAEGHDTIVVKPKVSYERGMILVTKIH